MILYSSSTCPKCKVLKMKLNNAGISYEVNENIEEMKELGIKSLPVLRIEDKLLEFSSAIAFIRDMEANKNDN